MNTKTNRRFGIYLPLMILLCTVSCTLRTVAVFLGVDEYGYFRQTTLNSVSAWILIAAIVLMLTYPIAYAKRPVLPIRHTTPLTFIPSLLCALVLIFLVGEMGVNLLSSLFPIDRIIHLIVLALGVASAVYFFSLAVVESGVSDRKANLGMALVLMLSVYAASLYLNTEIPRNSHVEIAEEMTLIAVSLFFLYEIRISLDKPRQNLYVTFGFIASMLCAYTALPSLIFYIASGRLLVSALSVLLLILALLIFTVSRLYLFNITPEDAAIAPVCSLAKAAKERAAAVREAEALYAPVPDPIPEEEISSEQTEDVSIDGASEPTCDALSNAATEQASDLIGDESAQQSADFVEGNSVEAESVPTDAALEQQPESVSNEAADPEATELPEAAAQEEQNPEDDAQTPDGNNENTGEQTASHNKTTSDCIEDSGVESEISAPEEQNAPTDSEQLPEIQDDAPAAPMDAQNDKQEKNEENEEDSGH